MADSTVYYMDAHSESTETSLAAKMVTVFDAAGLDEIVEPNDIVAIKVHCGEWNNSAYLRPLYARTLADRIKELGGRPFVCDTTTSTYSPWGSRSSELDILLTAERNGYSSATLGCPFICADGFIGTNDFRVDIPEGYILKEAYVAQAIAAADALIALTHFKGHSMGVIGGALKNLGIGAQSKRGKFNVHMGGHPTYGLGAAGVFHPENFKGKENTPDWEILEDCCPFGLYNINENDELEWDSDKCANCLGCFGVMGPRGLMDIPPVQFDAVDFYGLFSLNPLQQLFLLGGIAISVGVYSYSRRVMFTVGKDLYNLSPVSGWVVIMAHSIVLFMFASKGLSAWLDSAGLPQMPLVPVSSSQAVIGAVLGIGLIRGRHGIRWNVLGEIGLGWLLTPLISALLCIAALAVFYSVFR